jgi:nucleoside phosphorylase
VSNEGKLRAQLQGIKSVLDKLEAEYDKGIIDIGRYVRMKVEYETSKAELEQELDSLAHSQQTHTATLPNQQPSRADVLLVTVTKVEALAVLDLVKEKFGREYERQHIDLETYYDLGIIGGARTLMVRSEMGAGGPSGSILTISDSIRVLSPSAVIMVGIAFGIPSKERRIGDILVSKQILDYELQRVGTGVDDELVIIPRGDRPSAPSRLLDRFRDGELSWGGPKVEFGLVLSGDKLVDNIDFREQLREFELEAIGGEMEGGGLYSAAHRRKIDWIVVKAICDWADGEKHRNKRQRQEKAARSAANFTLHVIEQGGLVTNLEPEDIMNPGEKPVHPSIIHSTDDSVSAIFIDPDKPPVAIIRELLQAAFTAKTLRRFCQNNNEFSSLGYEFSPADGLVDMVDRVIDYCWKRLLWNELLSKVAQFNPRQYARFEPRLQDYNAGELA